MGHVPVRRLYEAGSAAVRQLATEPCAVDQPQLPMELTYEDIFDARCACRQLAPHPAPHHPHPHSQAVQCLPYEATMGIAAMYAIMACLVPEPSPTSRRRHMSEWLPQPAQSSPHVVGMLHTPVSQHKQGRDVAADKNAASPAQPVTPSPLAARTRRSSRAQPDSPRMSDSEDSSSAEARQPKRRRLALGGQLVDDDVGTGQGAGSDGAVNIQAQQPAACAFLGLACMQAQHRWHLLYLHSGSCCWPFRSTCPTGHPRPQPSCRPITVQRSNCSGRACNNTRRCGHPPTHHTSR